MKRLADTSASMSHQVDHIHTADELCANPSVAMVARPWNSLGKHASPRFGKRGYHTFGENLPWDSLRIATSKSF